MTTPLFDLTGKVALITGGSKGLGKAMARGFAEAGADIVICSRHAGELELALPEILKGTSVRGHSFVTDMTNRSEVELLAKSALDVMGRVDILVNNAGSNIPQAIDEIEDEKWDRIIELNLTSCMSLSRALIPQMKQRQWGRIIHISSVMGLTSKAGRSSYSATKAALIGMARAMGERFARRSDRRRIRVGQELDSGPMRICSKNSKWLRFLRLLLKAAALLEP